MAATPIALHNSQRETQNSPLNFLVCTYFLKYIFHAKSKYGIKIFTYEYFFTQIWSVVCTRHGGGGALEYIGVHKHEQNMWKRIFFARNA